MKHIIVISFLLFLTGVVTHAQNQVKLSNEDDVGFKVLDKCKFKCTYSYQYLSDSLNQDSRKEGVMVLLIGENSCNVFKNEYNYYIDSMRYLNSKGLVSNEQVSASFTQYSPGDGFRFFIISKHNEPVVRVIYPTTEGTWETEDVVHLEWELGGKSDSINGYYCRDAYTFFRGRKYTAWYAPDMPIPYGPYKFSGLPGLIIKISDLQNSHVFELRSIQENSFAMVRENKKTIKMTPSQFNKAIKNYRMGMIEKAKTWFPNDPGKVERLTKRILSENNSIELE